MKKFALMTLVILLVLSAVSFGGLQRKLWWDTPTGSIDEAWAVINGDTAPDVVDVVGDATSGDQGVDNYVGSFSGALIVPADGDYTFYVASDDDSQLLLDGAVVAYVSGWTGNQDWASGSAHPSAPMSLTAGQLLAVDMAFREGGGGDHFSIGWLTPDSNEIVLLPDTVTYPSTDTWPNTPVPASAATGVVEAMLSWQAPTGVENPTYTIAFGTDPAALEVKEEGLTEPVYDAGMLGTELAFSTTYYWKVTVDGGDGSGFLWSFTTADPIIINSVSGDAQPVGAAAQLSVDAVSPLGAELSYQWHRLNVELPGGIVIPDAPIPGADSAVHEIEAISTADEGSYYVVVSCVDGEIASSVVILDAQTGLIHRWSFGDSVDGVTLPDSVGGADGTLINNTGLASITDGEVVLGNDGSQSSNGNNGDANGDYVDLPNGLISSLTQMTIEVWTTWDNDSQQWQRVYDFGISNDGEGLSSAATNPDVYNLYFTPKRWDNQACVEYRKGGTAPQFAPGGTLALGQETLITQVHDDKADQVRLYVNGIAVGGFEALFPLQAMTDKNNWLGRSQWGDTLYVGSFNELRIYDTALLGDQIAADYLAGPDELGQLPEPTGDPAAIGDLNGDGVYDLLDMAIAADKWLTSLLNEQAED
jgi:hypothetical protein